MTLGSLIVDLETNKTKTKTDNVIGTGRFDTFSDFFVYIGNWEEKRRKREKKPTHHHP